MYSLIIAQPAPFWGRMKHPHKRRNKKNSVPLCSSVCNMKIIISGENSLFCSSRKGFYFSSQVFISCAHDFHCVPIFAAARKSKQKEPPTAPLSLPTISYILRHKELPAVRQLSVFSKYRKVGPKLIADVGCPTWIIVEMFRVVALGKNEEST